MTPENRACLEAMLEEGGPVDGAFDYWERDSLAAALAEINSLKARLEAVKVLCDEAIAGGHVETQRCELPCLACLAEDVLRAAEVKP